MELVTVRLDAQLLRVFQNLVTAGHAEAQRRSDRSLCIEGFILAQTIRQIPADGRLVLRRSEYRIVADLVRLGKAARLATAEGQPPADEALVQRVEARIASVARRSPHHESPDRGREHRPRT